MESKEQKRPLKLGQVIDHMDKSARLVINTAAGYPVYRGYVGNYKKGWANEDAEVNTVRQQMETYRTEDGHFDWKNIHDLPAEIPVKEIERYKTGELTHLIYTEIQLENPYKPKEEQE